MIYKMKEIVMKKKKDLLGYTEKQYKMENANKTLHAFL